MAYDTFEVRGLPIRLFLRITRLDARIEDLHELIANLFHGTEWILEPGKTPIRAALLDVDRNGWH